MEEKPKFKIVSQEHRGQTFTLSGPKHTVGRTENCDICIPNSAVSSRHCALTRQEDGDYLLTDLDSTNGTVVNGKKVDEVKLQHSDIVRIGSIEIIYESPVKSEKKSLPKDDETEGKIDLRETVGSARISDSPNFSPFSTNQPGIYRGLGRFPKVIGFGVLAAVALIVIIVLVCVFRDLIG